jgi:hypothetical protein
MLVSDLVPGQLMVYFCVFCSCFFFLFSSIVKKWLFFFRIFRLFFFPCLVIKKKNVCQWLGDRSARCFISECSVFFHQKKMTTTILLKFCRKCSYTAITLSCSLISKFFLIVKGGGECELKTWTKNIFYPPTE